LLIGANGIPSVALRSRPANKHFARDRPTLAFIEGVFNYDWLRCWGKMVINIVFACEGVFVLQPHFLAVESAGGA